MKDFSPEERLELDVVFEDEDAAVAFLNHLLARKTRKSMK